MLPSTYEFGINAKNILRTILSKTSPKDVLEEDDFFSKNG